MHPDIKDTTLSINLALGSVVLTVLTIFVGLCLFIDYYYLGYIDQPFCLQILSNGNTVESIIYVASVILLLRWVYLCYSNLCNTDGDMSYSPTMVFMRFFIPILNIVAPYAIIREISFKLKNLSREHRSQTYQPNQLIGLWWLMNIFAVFSNPFTAVFIQPIFLRYHLDTTSLWTIPFIIRLIAGLMLISILLDMKKQEAAAYRRYTNQRLTEHDRNIEALVVG